MKKLFITGIAALLALCLHAQEFTNLYTAYRQHKCIVADDSLIYVGCSKAINIYHYDGSYKTSVAVDGDVYSAVRDNNGHLWFGVFAYSNSTIGGGIIKYDGYSWEFIPVNNNFVYTGITSITCDHDNNIWACIVPYDGQNPARISKYNGTHWIDYTTFNDTLILVGVDEIVCDTNNVIFAGTKFDNVPGLSEIIAISATDTTIFDYINYNYTIACKHSSLVDRQNRVWFGGCYGHINSFDNGMWTVHDDYATFNNGSFSAIYQDFQDRMILATGSKLFTEGEIDWEVNTYLEEHSLAAVSDIKADSEQQVWLVGNFDSGDAREGCLIKPIADTFQLLHPQSHIGYPREIAFSEDNIWLGKSAYLSHFDGEIWNNNFTSENLCSEITTAICTDINGNLWYGTENGLFKQSPNQPAEQILQLCGEDISIVQCIASIGNTLWVKASGLNLYKYNGSEWTEIDMTNAASSYFLKIVPRNENEFWVASNAGAIRFDGTNWSNYSVEDGLLHSTVNDYAFQNDSVWMTTPKGIALLYNDQLSILHNDSTYLSGYSNYYSIVKDKHGVKWAGSKKGVLKFNNETSEYIYPSTQKEQIFCIKEDPDHNLWFCGSNAVSKYTFDNSNIETPIAEQNNLKIFPNPAQQEIYFDLPTNNQSDFLEIYNTNGAIIYQQNVQSGTNKIDIESLPVGMYLVRINGANLYGKFVKE
ncbi:MAG: T9SS type A sorting domain-containing protein [Bacteroidales bacterium]|nr:T9SS type A sorting domain-containing protein [Bacteroidales bacterium]